MNLDTAYSILEIPKTSTQDEVKKQYRKLTKLYHPDINKEPGAEDKFKKINEAYQVITSGKSTDHEIFESPFGNSNPFDGFFNPFGSGKRHYSAPINLNITISFRESIIGCSKNLKYNRHIKCNECDGQGKKAKNNGCSKCGGKGVFSNRNGNMIFTQTCDKCFGKQNTEACNSCSSTGTISVESSVNITIPGGINNDSILRLAGMGNYSSNFMGIEQYTDAHLRVQVDKDAHLRLDGQNVISHLDISLLEALKGCSKEVKTIDGPKTININPASKNMDEVIIPNMGVNRTGAQKVILDVKYPQELSSLIEFLSNRME